MNAPEDTEVLALCEKHGFGAVMYSAARLWRERDTVAALTVGPCVGAPAQFEMEPEPQDVRALVLDMRDAFLTMVTGFNTVGAYGAAQDAQTMAVSLNAFERKHSVTGLAWPLEVIREEGNSPGLKTVYENDNVRYGEDL